MLRGAHLTPPSKGKDVFCLAPRIRFSSLEPYLLESVDENSSTLEYGGVVKAGKVSVCFFVLFFLFFWNQFTKSRLFTDLSVIVA